MERWYTARKLTRAPGRSQAAGDWANTRLRWTFHPPGDPFVVYHHNALDRLDRWVSESNELLVKVQYAVRM